METYVGTIGYGELDKVGYFGSGARTQLTEPDGDFSEFQISASNFDFEAVERGVKSLCEIVAETVSEIPPGRYFSAKEIIGIAAAKGYDLSSFTDGRLIAAMYGRDAE